MFLQLCPTSFFDLKQYRKQPYPAQRIKGLFRVLILVEQTGLKRQRPTLRSHEINNFLCQQTPLFKLPHFLGFNSKLQYYFCDIFFSLKHNESLNIVVTIFSKRQCLCGDYCLDG